MDRLIVRIPVYIAFGLAIFLVALVVTFPDKRIKEIVTVQLESKLDGKYDVDIDDLDLWWLTGVELEGVTIAERVSETARQTAPQDKAQQGPQKPAKANTAAAKDPSKNNGKPSAKSAANGPPRDKPLTIAIPRVAAGFSPVSSLINLAPTVDFLVDVGGGDITGNYVQGSDQRGVEVDIDDVDLAKTALLESMLGVPFSGTLGGTVDLEFSPSKPLVTGGHITLKGRDLHAEKSTVNVSMAFLDVPRTDFGKLDADLDIDKPDKGVSPTVTFDTFRFHDGNDIRGQIWGDIDLGRTMKTSRAKLKMRFQFDDEFIRTNDLSSVLRLKWLREGKNKDWYGFVLLGRLADPQFKGAPTAANGPPEEHENAKQADK